MMDHPSLTSVDLGNSDIMNNRNRIYDEGFMGVIQGIIKSQHSLISELHFQSACITGDGLCALSLMRNVDLQVLDLSHNDLGNEGAYFLKSLMPRIVSMNLASTKIGLKGICELSKAIGHEESPRLMHLDLSQNNLEAEGFARLLTKLKSSTTLQTLLVSDNEMSLYDENLSALTAFFK